MALPFSFQTEGNALSRHSAVPSPSHIEEGIPTYFFLEDSTAETGPYYYTRAYCLSPARRDPCWEVPIFSPL